MLNRMLKLNWVGKRSTLLKRNRVFFSDELKKRKDAAEKEYMMR